MSRLVWLVCAFFNHPESISSKRHNRIATMVQQKRAEQLNWQPELVIKVQCICGRRWVEVE